MIKVAFIGAGRMASAMVHGLLRTQACTPDAIGCACGDDPTGPALAAATGIRHEPDWPTLLADADVIVLACKPQQFDSLDDRLAELASGKLALSILAGTTLTRLEERLGRARNVVRAMPNTPGQIGAGISAYASRTPLSDADKEAVNSLLGALGPAIAVPESQLDAVTAISGSGPAYVFEFTTALAAAGEKAGLPAETAAQLARQTVIGAGLLMQASTESPETLRQHVTSPGGTTQAALEQFEADGLRAVVERAVDAAQRRSIELAG